MNFEKLLITLIPVNAGAFCLRDADCQGRAITQIKAALKTCGLDAWLDLASGDPAEPVKRIVLEAGRLKKGDPIPVALASKAIREFSRIAWVGNVHVSGQTYLGSLREH